MNVSGPQKLEWKVRFKVALGVADGLRYLHHECPRRIIHRDIKASNILLNENYDPEVLLVWLLTNCELFLRFNISKH